MLKGHLYADPAMDNTSRGFFYQFFVLNYLIILYKLKLHWFVKAIGFSCLFIAQYLVYRAGYIYITKGLFFTVTSIDLIGCYSLIVIFDYFLTKQTSTPRPD